MAVVVEQPNIAIHIQDAVVLQKSEKMEFLLLLPERSPSSVSTTISTSSKGSSNEPTTGSLSIGSPSSVSKKWNSCYCQNKLRFKFQTKTMAVVVEQPNVAIHIQDAVVLNRRPHLINRRPWANQ